MRRRRRSADFGKLPTVEQVSLSPNGEKLAYIANVGDARRMIVRKIGGANLFALNTGKQKARYVGWLDDGHIVVVMSQTIGQWFQRESYERGELDQSTIIDATTGKATLVFGDTKKILNATFRVLRRRHRRRARPYGMFAGQPLETGGNAALDFDTNKGYLSKNYLDLYKVNLNDGHAAMMSGGSMLHDMSWVVDTAGGIVAHAEYVEKSGDWRLYADPSGHLSF